MSEWLLDTLFWTALLIGAVLLIRRPVAKWFGPQIAYALWAIPVVRLLMPPVELPGWLAAQPEISNISNTSVSVLSVSSDNATPVTAATVVEGSGSAASGGAMPLTPQPWFELEHVLTLGLLAWLAGAAIFLVMRFSAYFRLRKDLLAEGREVGRLGRVRLVETPYTKTPLAFGVLDPVIALPPGFMALPDRTARDLALAHELEHHRGRDLLINVAVQPLFAMHWWNPLGHYGWLALRRDQEAACDARVIAAKPSEDRATYAGVIAGFAAGPEVALAAPMACPVLGEKSIIQRLRILTMTEHSRRRRMAGRALLGVSVLALPLTASISYAEIPAPKAPAAPSVAVAVPKAPVAPAAPLAPLAQAIIEVDPDTGETRVEADLEDEDDGQTIVIRRDADEDGDGVKEKRIEKIKVIKRGKGMSEEEMDAIMLEVREELAEADRVLKDVPGIIEEAMAEVMIATEEGQNRVKVKMTCRGNSKQVADVKEVDGEVREVRICQANAMAHALKGIQQARDEIARSRDMSKTMRKRILKELDQQIAAWKNAES